MILVDYKCNKCNNIFEGFYNNRSDNHVICPECGESDVSRMLTAPAQLNTNFADKPSHRSRKRIGIK